jgi:hypothetical protein
VDEEEEEKKTAAVKRGRGRAAQEWVKVAEVTEEVE